MKTFDGLIMDYSLLLVRAKSPLELKAAIEQILEESNDADTISSAMIMSPSPVLKVQLAEKLLSSEHKTPFHLLEVMANAPNLQSRAWEMFLLCNPSDYIIRVHASSINGMTTLTETELLRRHQQKHPKEAVVPVN